VEIFHRPLSRWLDRIYFCHCR